MFSSIPRVTRGLILANIVVFLLEQVARNALVAWFALWPVSAGFLPWQVLTYGFLHADVFHLAFNMFALYMFGSEIERVVGETRYLAYYVVCILTAALAQLVVSFGLPPYPTLGASGGVFGVLLAFGLYFPRRMILLIIPPIPLPAWLFVTVYGMIELYMGVTGTQAGVAHFAHLGGMLGGYLVIRYWRRAWPFSAARR